jgi:hypothetical protein
MTQRSDEVKSMIAETLVSLRDSFAKAEFLIANSFATFLRPRRRRTRTLPALAILIAGTIGGWSCTSPGPALFDGGYNIQKLPVGHSYTVYAEPLDGAVDPSQMANAIQTLCATPQPMLAGHSIQLCCARNQYGIYRSN